MAIDHVLVSKGPGETRVALLSGDRLTELWVARTGMESLVGNIYLGRVEAALKGLDAAFVDIGHERAGFLALPEARPPEVAAALAQGAGDGPRDRIGDYVGEGDAVLVQVSRDPVEDKGAKLTTHVNLAGVRLVLRPGQPGVAVARRIADEAERDRLTAAANAVRPEGDGFIVRTAAAGAAVDAIEAEAGRLVERWAEIRHKRANARAPALLHAELDPARRALRETGEGVRRVVADDGETLTRLRAYAEAEIPALRPLIEAHDGDKPLFEAFGVEAAIDEALSPLVALPGGGSLIVSQTPALTAIDVNSGGAEAGSREETALAVDLEAAAEAAGQVRLRNISGLIVIDFVPLRDSGHKRRVLDALRDAAAGDPGGPHVVGHTRMGLVEMTRRRHGPSLQEVMGEPWPGTADQAPAKSALTLALDALRGALRDARGKGAPRLVLRLPPAVADAMAGPARAALAEAEALLGVAIEPAPDQTLASGAWDLGTREGE